MGGRFVGSVGVFAYAVGFDELRLVGGVEGF